MKQEVIIETRTEWGERAKRAEKKAYKRLLFALLLSVIGYGVICNLLRPGGF